MVSQVNEPLFWMGGQLATDLQEITNDPGKLDSGFWAVTTKFDGELTFAKFGNVVSKQWPFAYKPLSVSDWKSSHSRESYCQLVENFRAEIAAGNIYQVNACRLLTLESSEEISGLMAGFLQKNPAQFAGYLKLPNLEIVSASPERFLSRNGSTIRTSPIKGTREAKQTGRFPEKDESENIMILDLMRNDIGRIAIKDSVKVSKLLDIVELPGLAHLISEAEGQLLPGISWSEILNATLPPGSVSGAPKSSAIKLIKKYEKLNRGPYCGAFGWINGDQAELAVAIRTFWSDGEKIRFGTGAGITWASDPKSEWDETELKAARLMAIATGKL
jgi:para-aminobenzoate synthetase component 1